MFYTGQQTFTYRTDNVNPLRADRRWVGGNWGWVLGKSVNGSSSVHALLLTNAGKIY